MDKYQQAAIAAINSGQGVLFTGGCGSGKTHRAIMLAWHWVAHRLDVDAQPSEGMPVFLPIVELLQQIKATFGKEGEEEQALLSSLATKPLLILDDLGAEKLSEWSRSCLYLLIDRRYRDMRQTILTTNLSLDQLAGVDDRLASRLVEMCAVVDLGTKDHRLEVRRVDKLLPCQRKGPGGYCIEPPHALLPKIQNLPREGEK